MVLLVLPFLILAAAGFALSVAAHGCALCGVASPLGDRTMWLHMGIFAVWPPAMLAASRLSRGAANSRSWKVLLRGCPGWMRGVMFACFAYAVVNFVLFAVSTAGRGKALRAQAGGAAPPEVVAGFSGHWMAFYFAAFAVLYSYLAVRSSRG